MRALIKGAVVYMAALPLTMLLVVGVNRLIHQYGGPSRIRWGFSQDAVTSVAVTMTLRERVTWFDQAPLRTVSLANVLVAGVVLFILVRRDKRKRPE